MKLKDILEKKGGEVFSIPPDATLKQAVDELVKHNVGALLVRELNGEVVGILSERDILHQCRKTETSWPAVLVRDVMTRQVITSDAERTVDEAVLQMFLNQIRHLPVTVRGRPEGVVSVRDMLLASLLHSQEESLRFSQFMTTSFEKMGGKKILIADEAPQTLALFETVFTACGVTVLKAQDGESCLRKIREEKPDLAVLSDLLSGLSGYEVVEKLQQGPEELKKVPLIVMADRPNMGSLFRGLGVEHYLPKPVSPYVLLKHAEAIFQYGVEALARSGPKNYAVGAGIQQYEMEQIRSFLRSLALTTDLYGSEEECLKAIRKDRPKFVFVFFWEESEKFDAARIYREMQADPRLATVPFACLCNVLVEANCRMSGLRKVTVPYEHVDDLMKKFVTFLREKVIPR